MTDGPARSIANDAASPSYMSIFNVNVLLACISFSIVLPSLLPYLLKTSASQGNEIYPLVVCGYSVGEIVGSFAGGYAYSESCSRMGRVGAKVTLVRCCAIGVVGSAMYVLGGYLGSVWLVMAGRFVQGVWTGGQQSVEQSYLSENTKNAEDRTRLTSVLGRYAVIGFMLGPAIGGCVSFVNIEINGFVLVDQLNAVGWFVTLCCVVMWAVTRTFFDPEGGEGHGQGQGQGEGEFLLKDGGKSVHIDGGGDANISNGNNGSIANGGGGRNGKVKDDKHKRSKPSSKSSSSSPLKKLSRIVFDRKSKRGRGGAAAAAAAAAAASAEDGVEDSTAAGVDASNSSISISSFSSPSPLPLPTPSSPSLSPSPPPPPSLMSTLSLLLTFLAHFYSFAVTETITTPMLMNLYDMNTLSLNMFYVFTGGVALVGNLVGKGGRMGVMASLALGAAGSAVLMDEGEAQLGWVRFLVGFTLVTLAFPLGE